MRRLGVAMFIFLVAAGTHKPVVLGLDDFLKNGKPVPLVDIRTAIPDAAIDLRYATTNNVAARKLYTANVCVVRKELLKPLAAADAELRKHGFKLLFWDCYRPYHFQQILYDAAVAKGLKGLFANPKYGSNHNRGTAVDVSLVRLNGEPVVMPTDFDALGKDARSNAVLKNQEAQRNRELLKSVMRKHGFGTIRKEWWHFNFRNAKAFPLLDIPLEYFVSSK